MNIGFTFPRNMIQRFPPHSWFSRTAAGYTDRNGNNPTLNVIDNLIAQKKIPVIICVFINPGDISDFARYAHLQFRESVFGQMESNVSRIPCAARCMTP